MTSLKFPLLGKVIHSTGSRDWGADISRMLLFANCECKLEKRPVYSKGEAHGPGISPLPTDGPQTAHSCPTSVSSALCGSRPTCLAWPTSFFSSPRNGCCEGSLAPQQSTPSMIYASGTDCSFLRQTRLPLQPLGGGDGQQAHPVEWREPQPEALDVLVPGRPGPGEHKAAPGLGDWPHTGRAAAKGRERCEASNNGVTQAEIF